MPSENFRSYLSLAKRYSASAQIEDKRLRELDDLWRKLTVAEQMEAERILKAPSS